MQIIGRPLHGKEIVDWEKKPKKEIFVADIVSRASRIVWRNITIRSLSRLSPSFRISYRDTTLLSTYTSMK
jgi:hypothetical protein